MKTKTLLPSAVLTCVGIGALGFGAVHAQSPSTPKQTAYYISEFEVTDPEGLKPYRERVDSKFRPFGGRYIVRGGAIASLEGEAPNGRIVVIAFDSMENARAWYDLPAYQELKPIRHKAAKSRVFIVEGISN